MAGNVNAELLHAQCWAPPALRRSRMAARHDGISDADHAIAEHMGADADPWPEAIRLVNTGTEEATLRELMAQLGCSERTESSTTDRLDDPAHTRSGRAR